MSGGIIDPNIHRFSDQIGGAVGIRYRNRTASGPRAIRIRIGKGIPSDKISVEKI